MSLIKYPIGSYVFHKALGLAIVTGYNCGVGGSYTAGEAGDTKSTFLYEEWPCQVMFFKAVFGNERFINTNNSYLRALTPNGKYRKEQDL